MKTRIQKWGNSLAVRIPRAFASDLGLEREATVELVVEDGTLVLKPVVGPRYELGDLLSRVTESNLHNEHEWGEATGAEEW